MYRLPPLPVEIMTPEQRRVHDQIAGNKGPAVVGPLLAALQRPSLAEPWSHMGIAIRAQTSIPKHLSSIAVLQTVRFMNSRYMWAVQIPLANKAGLAEDIIQSIRMGRTPRLDEEQLKIWRFCTELLEKRAVSDGTYAAVTEAWGPVGAVDLTATIGYYVMTAFTIAAHQIDPPEGFPADLPVPAPG
jgi:4-carboxymuconolactone decarboxylase